MTAAVRSGATGASAPAPERKTWISFPDGKRYFLEMRSGTPDDQMRWQDALRRAYGHQLCCCCRNQPLAVRRRGTTYYIALFKMTGPKHAPFCSLHGDAFTAGNVTQRYVGAIRENGDRVVISLDVSLRLRTIAPAPSHAPRRRSSSQHHARTTLHTTLRYLWERAKLNSWHPGTAERTPASVGRRIYHAADGVDAAGLTLGRLLVTARFDTDPQRYAAALRAHVGAARADKHALLLFGEVATNPEAGVLERLQTLARDCGLAVTAQQLVLDAALHSYQRQLRYREGRLLVLCAAFPTDAHCLDVVDLGLIATSEDFIPVDSLHELEVARLLTRERRSFAKPLRDARAGHLPDFVLYDTPDPVEMEVFGRTDPDYVAKADRKRRRDIWWWDATTHDRIPPFPRAATNGQRP
jgi:hypothetical protein